MRSQSFLLACIALLTRYALGQAPEKVVLNKPVRVVGLNPCAPYSPEYATSCALSAANDGVVGYDGYSIENDTLKWTLNWRGNATMFEIDFGARYRIFGNIRITFDCDDDYPVELRVDNGSWVLAGVAERSPDVACEGELFTRTIILAARPIADAVRFFGTNGNGIHAVSEIEVIAVPAPPTPVPVPQATVDDATPVVTTLAAVPTPTIPCGDAGIDGNLQVLYPPLLDENNTHVTFQDSRAYFNIRVVVPRQYETANFSFEGALSPLGGYDSENQPSIGTFWSKDEQSDDCNIIYTGRIPWVPFRALYGGLTEQVHFEEYVYSTVIVIETTKALIVRPETLLELQQAELPPGHQILQQTEFQFTRLVLTKIPFKIEFDRIHKPSADIYIRSNHLRVAAALLETSVVEVYANRDAGHAFAEAHLEVVTRIPLPLRLEHATIVVDRLELSNLSISLLSDSRTDCEPNNAFCTQYWEIDVYPEQCVLDGEYNITVYAVCHDQRQGCAAPQPNSTLLEMDILSDDFCGLAQTIEIMGNLTLHDTTCNEQLAGTVDVYNADGAAINNTEILSVRAYPTLNNPEPRQFVEIYDRNSSALPLLNYTATLVSPDQVDFTFNWEGSALRCDVLAEIEVKVQVVYQATRSLGTSAKKLLSFGGDGRDHNTASLMQVRGGATSDQSLIIASAARISAEPGAGGGGGAVSGDGDAEVARRIAGMSSPIFIGIVGTLAAILVVAVACGLLYVWRIKARTRNAAKIVVANDGYI